MIRTYYIAIELHGLFLTSAFSWLEQEIMVKGIVNGAQIDVVNRANNDITSTMEETKKVIQDQSNAFDSDKPIK